MPSANEINETLAGQAEQFRQEHGKWYYSLPSKELEEILRLNKLERALKATREYYIQFVWRGDIKQLKLALETKANYLQPFFKMGNHEKDG